MQTYEACQPFLTNSPSPALNRPSFTAASVGLVVERDFMLENLVCSATFRSCSSVYPVPKKALRRRISGRMSSFRSSQKMKRTFGWSLFSQPSATCFQQGPCVTKGRPWRLLSCVLQYANAVFHISGTRQMLTFPLFQRIAYRSTLQLYIFMYIESSIICYRDLW